MSTRLFQWTTELHCRCQFSFLCKIQIFRFLTGSNNNLSPAISKMRSSLSNIKSHSSIAQPWGWKGKRIQLQYCVCIHRYFLSTKRYCWERKPKKYVKGYKITLGNSHKISYYKTTKGSIYWKSLWQDAENYSVAMFSTTLQDIIPGGCKSS